MYTNSNLILIILESRTWTHTYLSKIIVIQYHQLIINNFKHHGYHGKSDIVNSGWFELKLKNLSLNNTLVILFTKILVWQRGHFGYSQEFDDFSSLYWIPNLHKNPHRERYTADTSTFSTHELFINLDTILSAVKGGLHSHCHSLCM